LDEKLLPELLEWLDNVSSRTGLPESIDTFFENPDRFVWRLADVLQSGDSSLVSPLCLSRQLESAAATEPATSSGGGACSSKSALGFASDFRLKGSNYSLPDVACAVAVGVSDGPLLLLPLPFLGGLELQPCPNLLARSRRRVEFSLKPCDVSASRSDANIDGLDSLLAGLTLLLLNLLNLTPNGGVSLPLLRQASVLDCFSNLLIGLCQGVNDSLLVGERSVQRLRLVFRLAAVVVPVDQCRNELRADGGRDAGNESGCPADNEPKLRDVVPGRADALVKAAGNAEEVFDSESSLLDSKASAVAEASSLVAGPPEVLGESARSHAFRSRGGAD
jgi:hypothetical protein